MARRRAAKRSMFDVAGGVNLTPLLDIIFNLIFFFVLATNIRERERYLEVTLPSSSTAQEAATEQQTPEVTVTRTGEIYFRGAQVSADRLREELTRLVREQNTREIVIVTDGEVTFQRFTDVTDICRAAGIQVVTPLTRARE